MLNQEDIALAVARELRIIARQIESKHAAQQCGELFADIPARPYREGEFTSPPMMRVAHG